MRYLYTRLEGPYLADQLDRGFPDAFEQEPLGRHPSLPMIQQLARVAGDELVILCLAGDDAP